MPVRVHARAALAGNPSDLHGGAVLSIPVRAFYAEVALEVETHASNELVEAVLRRLGRGDERYAVTTTIPREVGLAGSSAIVIAALHALGVPGTHLDIAQLALEIERDDLGIVAGLQDRAVQAFDAPVLTDIDREPQVRVLAPSRAMQFLVAWLPAAASDSGDYHRRTPSPSRGGMDQLAQVARDAAVAFERGDGPVLAALMGESALVRKQVAPLSTAHESLADTFRACGLSPNSTGSGGAVVAVITDDIDVSATQRDVEALGASSVIETVAP